MEYRFLLDNIEELLILNKGVNILSSKGNEKYLKVKFQVTDPASRLLLHHSAEAANTILDIWAHHSPSSEEGKKDPEGSLRYRFRTDISKETIDKFCWLGAHLAWQMYKTGAINSNNEKHYCKIFGADSKST